MNAFAAATAALKLDEFKANERREPPVKGCDHPWHSISFELFTDKRRCRLCGKDLPSERSVFAK
jgi:hypothetical protein